ncbi:hypothetical protein [Flavobacterium sp.]|uniref:hypothetical protein n=1 Tax=Flavobacterium sp. TaxID=239 RepID=UPI003752D7BB
MKKILIILALFMCTTIFAQDFSFLEKYELKSDESYVKAEPKVLECANYLFSHPIKENELNRLIATQFIMRWMEGCKHTFTIDNKMTDLVSDNKDLFGLYLAGMSKVVIESGATELSATEVHDKTAALLVAYCKNESNGVKPTKGLKKLM